MFSGRANKVIDINNFPKLDDIVFHEGNFADRDAIVCYAGGINELRGESVMLEAMKTIDGKMILAGTYDENGTCRTKGANVEYIGWQSLDGINLLYGRAVLGLVLLLTNPNYIWSRPIKMYEYMAAGLSFVCSDFHLGKRLQKSLVQEFAFLLMIWTRFEGR